MTRGTQRIIDAIKAGGLHFVMTDLTDPEQREITEWLLENPAYPTHVNHAGRIMIHSTLPPDHPAILDCISRLGDEK